MSVDFDQRPYLVLCEGESDKRFLDRLIAKRGIPNSFQTKFPDRDGGNIGGRQKFGRWLSLVSDNENFIQNVKAVIIVSDNDLVPKDSWDEIVAELNIADFPVPPEERVIAKKKGYPPVCVLMIPKGTPGDLETLCIEAAYEKWKIKPAIDAFVEATPAKEWVVTRKSKMMLQAILAATCAPRPDAGFAGHWREKEEYHLPLGSPAFSDIADFLANFEALLKAS